MSHAQYANIRKLLSVTLQTHFLSSTIACEFQVFQLSAVLLKTAGKREGRRQ